MSKSAKITQYSNDGTVTWILTDKGKSTRYVYSGLSTATFLKVGGIRDLYKAELKKGGTGFRTFIKFKNGIAKGASFEKEVINTEVDDLLKIISADDDQDYTPEPF